LGGHITSDTLRKTLATGPPRGASFMWGQGPCPLPPTGAGAVCTTALF